MSIKKCEIEKLLKDIGVETSIMGFYYLRDAVETVCSLGSPCLTHGKMGSMIYAPIAQKYNATRTSVERAMRYAKVHAFDVCDPRTISPIFSRNVSRHTGLPTNMEFISAISLYLLNNAESGREEYVC